MNEVFRPFLRQFVLVFFDDILIYNKSFEEYREHSRVVLSTLRQHQLFAKLSADLVVGRLIRWASDFG